MNRLFSDLLDRSVVVYLDDILIYLRDIESHEKHVRKVQDRLQKHKFYCKLKKCQFFTDSTTFLGHDIDGNGLHINANKVKAVREWPTPKTVRDI